MLSSRSSSLQQTLIPRSGARDRRCWEKFSSDLQSCAKFSGDVFMCAGYVIGVSAILAVFGYVIYLIATATPEGGDSRVIDMINGNSNGLTIPGMEMGKIDGVSEIGSDVVVHPDKNIREFHKKHAWLEAEADSNGVVFEYSGGWFDKNSHCCDENGKKASCKAELTIGQNQPVKVPYNEKSTLTFDVYDMFGNWFTWFNFYFDYDDKGSGLGAMGGHCASKEDSKGVFSVICTPPSSEKEPVSQFEDDADKPLSQLEAEQPKLAAAPRTWFGLFNEVKESVFGTGQHLRGSNP